ncbi:MAG: hypothetical protein WC976_06540 [Caldisericia bacterium]
MKNKTVDVKSKITIRHGQAAKIGSVIHDLVFKLMKEETRTGERLSIKRCKEFLRKQISNKKNNINAEAYRTVVRYMTSIIQLFLYTKTKLTEGSPCPDAITRLRGATGYIDFKTY